MRYRPSSPASWELSEERKGAPLGTLPKSLGTSDQSRGCGLLEGALWVCKVPGSILLGVTPSPGQASRCPGPYVFSKYEVGVPGAQVFCVCPGGLSTSMSLFWKVLACSSVCCSPGAEFNHQLPALWCGWTQ